MLIYNPLPCAKRMAEYAPEKNMPPSKAKTMPDSRRDKAEALADAFQVSCKKAAQPIARQNSRVVPRAPGVDARRVPKALSYDQHGVAEAVEPVFFLDRMAVGLHGMPISRKGADQHDQGAFRQVEIG